jgi:hypothetical protein
MSLTTDALGLAAAAAVAAGTAIQASQAFAELNAETPLKNTMRGLLLASFRALFSVVIPQTNVPAMDLTLRALRLGTGTEQDGQEVPLTAAQVKSLKKWIGWFWGWFLINLGAIAALAASIVAIVSDIRH